MNTFLRSDEFDDWLATLKDKIGRARIINRIRSAETGNFGDCEPVGEGAHNQAGEKAMTKFAPFDAADYLTDEETIAEYLNAALEDPSPDLFLVAVRDVARARGMTQLAKDAGLGRESLYKALTPGANTL